MWRICRPRGFPGRREKLRGFSASVGSHQRSSACGRGHDVRYVATVMATRCARRVWWPSVVFALIGGASAPATAAHLEPRTVAAYEQYVEQARDSFLTRVRSDEELSRATNMPVRRVTFNTATESSPQGRIVKIPGGLIHHWTAVTFMPGVGMDRVLAVAQAYDNYAAIYAPVITARLLEHDGDTFRVFARIKEDTGVVSAVLDVWTVVTYNQTKACAHSLSDASEIRQVKNPGEANEQLLPAGRDSGYLWRANTFTRFIARDGGVYVELETLGLSRGFPSLLGWIVEPIARRVGRSSVERTLAEFRAAVLAKVL